MIVVDSSVWISGLRRLDTTPVRKLRDILLNNSGELLVGDVVLLEVLQGARDATHAARLERNLREYPLAAMLDAELAVIAAANYRALRQRGVTIRKTNDLIIGTFCIERDHRLLHDDRDFEPMMQHLGLRVV